MWRTKAPGNLMSFIDAARAPIRPMRRVRSAPSLSARSARLSVSATRTPHSPRRAPPSSDRADRRPICGRRAGGRIRGPPLALGASSAPFARLSNALNTCRRNSSSSSAGSSTGSFGSSSAIAAREVVVVALTEDGREPADRAVGLPFEQQQAQLQPLLERARPQARASSRGAAPRGSRRNPG